MTDPVLTAVLIEHQGGEIARGPTGIASEWIAPCFLIAPEIHWAWIAIAGDRGELVPSSRRRMGALAALVPLIGLLAGYGTAHPSGVAGIALDASPNLGAPDSAAGAHVRSLGSPGRRSATLQAGPDLVVRKVDRAGMTGDWQALTVGGAMEVWVANDGDSSTGSGFDVAVFEDVDADGRLDSPSDTLLGQSGLDAVDAGAARAIRIPISGPVTFRHNLVHALVDSHDAVAETEEGNNVEHSGRMCEFRPPPGRFSPSLEWEWSTSDVVPRSNQVIMMPVVIDLTNDGVPEIVFSTFDGVTLDEDGILRAIHGDGSGEVFAVTDPRYAIRATAPIAAGDIDVDGYPEIVALAESGNALLAFERDGSFEWRSEVLPIRSEPKTPFRGGPALADLDGDGEPEIVIAATVLDGGGRIRWSAGPGTGQNWPGYGALSLVANLDMTGGQEVVAGNTAYRANGSTYWHDSSLGDGFNAVANLDGDELPEVVLVTQGRLYALEHDGTVKWGPRTLPGPAESNFGGPPTIADVDGDGEVEIGVAGGSYYTVFETDGRVRWSSATQDLSSSMTGSSVFDFEGDGSAEVVYGDERMLRIFRGTDGRVLWETPSPSGTVFDFPVIADVDADGNAEVVAVSNRWRRTDIVEPHGVQVYGDESDTWVRTRALWNQHTYHIDNARDDGAVPSHETPSWIHHNTYRLNLPERSVFLAPDLTASRLAIDDRDYPASVRVTARIGNGGAEVVAPGAEVAFYDGDPEAGADLVGVVATSSRLSPGQHEDVSVRWPAPGPGPHDVHAVADDDGSGRGQANECDETNNEHAARFVIAPTATPTVAATESPTASPSATASPSPRPPPTPSPTRSPPRLLHLPVALSERCDPGHERTDIALVIDTSSSMRGRKLADAKAATIAFVGLLDFEPGRDQVAVIRFDTSAELVRGLSADRHAVLVAIAGLEVRPGTHIDEGLRAGLAELESDRRILDNAAVIVLVTDGMHNGEPGGERAAAQRVRDAGVALYAIGLGGDVDESALVAMAGRADRYYFAPNSSQLERIYAEIARDIDCPADEFWGGR